MLPDHVEAFYQSLAIAIPEPKSELHYVNDYTLLVAVVLSAQATDAGVNKATLPLFAKVSTPAQMLDLGEAALREAIRSIGLYPTKTRNVLALSQILQDQYEGQIPASREALEALPGVGRKTANVVLNIAFGEPTIAVDTHCFRVANRTGLAPGKTPLEVELGLLKATPPQWLKHAHHYLVLHGRHVCKARAPGCSNCPVRQWCCKPL